MGCFPLSVTPKDNPIKIFILKWSAIYGAKIYGAPKVLKILKPVQKHKEIQQVFVHPCFSNKQVFPNCNCLPLMVKRNYLQNKKKILPILAFLTEM